MPRAGATAQRPVGGADTGAHRLPVVHDEVAGTRRALRLVFVLLVVMTGVAAFAVGGLITLRGGGSDAAVAPVGPEPIAAAVGRLASPAPTVPDPFDMLSPTVPAPGGVIAPPIIGLTPAPGATPTDPAASPTSSSGASPPTVLPSTSSTCPPGTDPSPSAPPAGGGADVPVVPLAPPCP